MKRVSLDEVVTDIVDNRGRSCPTAESGIPLIATNCIANDALFPSYEKLRFVSRETYDTWFRSHPKPGDIIFVNKGTPGLVCMVPDPVDFCIAQDMVALRPDPAKVYPKYLFAALRSPQVQYEIASMHVGTLIPHFRKGDFDKLLVPVPDDGAQETIGDVYYNLSLKIDLNQRMNRTLEAIARAIFKSWFIDFDPVIDNAILNGKLIPDEFAERAEARREILAPSNRGEGVAGYRHLFPDSFQDSPLGKIPKGWEVSTVGHEFRLTMGQSPPGSTYNEEGDGLPFFQGRRDFGFRFPTKRVFCTVPKRIAEAGDTLVSVRAPVGGVNMAPELLCVGRGLAGVRHRSGSRSYTYCAMVALQDHFREYESEGTVFGAINKSQFAALECVSPSGNAVNAFERRLFAMDETIRLNGVESSQLASVRETLLPRLLSGELQPVSREGPS